MTDLWTEASRDMEAEQAEARLIAARIAAAPVWAFVAKSTTDAEYQHRKALVVDRLEEAVLEAVGAADPKLLRDLEASLDADMDVVIATAMERREASEGQTCGQCGGSIEHDPASEDPSTWHHNDGSKHDHEAKPGGTESKLAGMGITCNSCGNSFTSNSNGVERCPKCKSSDLKRQSAKTATRYCKTHDVYVGEGNAANHDEACSMEDRATEASRKVAWADMEKGTCGTCSKPIIYDRESGWYHYFENGVPSGFREDHNAHPSPHKESKTAAKCSRCTNGNHSGSNGTAGCSGGSCSCSCNSKTAAGTGTHPSSTPEGGDHIGPKEDCPICDTADTDTDSTKQNKGDFYAQGSKLPAPGSRHPFGSRVAFTAKSGTCSECGKAISTKDHGLRNEGDGEWWVHDDGSSDHVPKPSVEKAAAKTAAAEDEFYLVKNDGTTGGNTIVSGPHTHAEAKELMKASSEDVRVMQGSHPQLPKAAANNSDTFYNDADIEMNRLNNGYYDEDKCPKCGAIDSFVSKFSNPGTDAEIDAIAERAGLERRAVTTCFSCMTTFTNYGGMKPLATLKVANGGPFPNQKGEEPGDDHKPNGVEEEPKAEGEDADPASMEPGTKVTVHYQTVTGEKGDCDGTFTANANGAFTFSYENGTFGVTQGAGGWVDSEGNTFTFSLAQEAPATGPDGEKAEGGEKPFPQAQASRRPFGNRTVFQSRRTASKRYEVAKQVLEGGVFDANGRAVKLEGQLIDHGTANLLVQAYESLSPENQSKFDSVDLLALVSMLWRNSSFASKTAGEMPRDKNTTCPKCDATMDDVRVYGNTLVAKCKCGWRGSKEKKTGAAGNPYTDANPYRPEEAAPGADSPMMEQPVQQPPTPPLQQPVTRQPNTTRPRTKPNGQPAEMASDTQQQQPLVQGFASLVEGTWDPPMAQINPEAPKPVNEHMRCSNCLVEFDHTVSDPADPMPVCPSCGSKATAVYPQIGSIGSKIGQVAKGIMVSNPGMDAVQAYAIARETVRRFPEMVKVPSA